MPHYPRCAWMCGCVSAWRCASTSRPVFSGLSLDLLQLGPSRSSWWGSEDISMLMYYIVLQLTTKGGYDLSTHSMERKKSLFVTCTVQYRVKFFSSYSLLGGWGQSSEWVMALLESSTLAVPRSVTFSPCTFFMLKLSSLGSASKHPSQWHHKQTNRQKKISTSEPQTTPGHFNNLFINSSQAQYSECSSKYWHIY